MTLRIYNTINGQKEEFIPQVPGKVGIYVCGVTVYDLCHIGHARSQVAFDVVVRYLRFLGYEVKFIRNFTDVDDKIIKRAQERGISAKELSTENIAAFYRDTDQLGLCRPDEEPRVSEHIPEIIALIQRLMEVGMAYEVEGDVFFEVRKFAPYGKLSGRNVDDMRAGLRIDVDQRKRSPLDFALWKAFKPGEPKWESPWGDGRPGWHIECSAMSSKYLGETLDIHGGGKDLIFPHHENEIAQSEGARGKTFVRYWMHNGFVNVDDEKMSKSLGNFFTIQEVLERFDPEVIRFFMLTTHYRSPINFSDQALGEAEKRLKYFYEALQRLQAAAGEAEAPAGVSAQAGPGPAEAGLLAGFRQMMDDDFNTAAALGKLSEAMRSANEALDSRDEEFDAADFLSGVRAIAVVLGLFQRGPADYLEGLKLAGAAAGGMDRADVEEMIAARNRARREKDWARADAIRNELLDKGILLKDGPEGTTWTVT